MSFQAVGDLVQVKRLEEDNSTYKVKGLDGKEIEIPQKFRQQSDLGVVISLGHKVTAPVQPGDVVKFGVYNAENLNDDGEEFLLIRENDIRGVKRYLGE